MVKRLMAKTGTYEKDGQTKGRYTEIGVIMSKDNGEYALLDPSVNLAGVMLQQQASSDRKGDRVMVSIFDNDRNRGQGQSQQSGGSQGRDMDDEIPF